MLSAYHHGKEEENKDRERSCPIYLKVKERKKERKKERALMDGREVYDAVSDVENIFSKEFRRYVRDEDLLCRYTDKKEIYNSSIWLFNKKELEADDVDSAYLDLLYKMTMKDSYLYPGENCLVQFWKAEEQTVADALGKNCSILSTRNQPFLISGSQTMARYLDGSSSYRMKMVDIITGGEGGVIGRVFEKGIMEYTPSVSYYSSKEYPHRDLAQSCHIQGSLALPLADSSGRLVGVLEVVSSNGLSLQDEILAVLWKSSSLRYLHHCKDICQQEKVLHVAISEIKEVMNIVGKSCGLARARTWIVCNRCGSLSISKTLVGEDDASYDSFGGRWFIEAERLCTPKKGEGIVGKAVASSHDLVYCGNVSQFSITEYPLAHFARHHILSASCAISLKSDLTGSQIYVLEFFWNPGEINGLDRSYMFDPILEGMRQNFRTFRLASGEEIARNLSVQVIDAIYPDKSEILKVGKQISIIEAGKPYLSPYSIGDSSTNNTDDPITGIGRYHLPHSAEESSTNKTNNQMTGVPAYLLPYSITKSSRNEADDLMTGIGPYPFPHSVNESSTNKPDDAMNRIGSFPLPNSIGESSRNKTDDLMNGAGSYLLPHMNGEGSTQGTASSASTVQSKCWLTMNVIYGGNSFRFQLSSSSNLPELSQQVLQSLSLHEGTYNVSYLDDNDDSILIGCDEDLRDYISCSMKQDKYTLMMQIEPK